MSSICAWVSARACTCTIVTAVPGFAGGAHPAPRRPRLPFVSAAALLLRGGCCGEVRRRGRARARGVTRSQLRQCRPRGRREQRRSRSSSAWVEGRAAPSKCTVPTVCLLHQRGRNCPANIRPASAAERSSTPLKDRRRVPARCGGVVDRTPTIGLLR
eukprot:scaffold444_cov185-Prasinococcus_capsulatus_cf.AAC.1